MATAGLVKNLGDIADAGVKAVGDQANTAIDNMWADEKDRKEAVKEFKDLLVKFTKTTGGPIIIVVDELDRCRPDYALSVLEIIKHFFAVPRVHFILGINSDALENSVRARYGAGIDATGYLKKSINVAFSLPRFTGERGEENIVLKYTEALGHEMRLPQMILNRLLSLLEVITDGRDISLRDIGKILSKVALLPSEAKSNKKMQAYTDLACVLIVTSVLDPRLHTKLVHSTASTAEIRAYLGVTREKTYTKLEGVTNAMYKGGVVDWYLTIAYCCAVDNLNDIEAMGSNAVDLKNSFGYRSMNTYKTIPRDI